MAGYRASDGARVGETKTGDDGLSANEWMARRNAQVAQRGRAGVAGRQAWTNSIRTGRDVDASDAGHIRSTGMRALSDQRTPTGSSHGYNPNEPRDDRGRWTTGGAGASTTYSAQKAATISYGLLRTPAPSDEDLAELRRQQQVLANAVLKPDAENSWLAVPALAALLALTLPEDAAAWAAGETLPEAGQAPLDLPERDPYRRVGDNWATRKGRQAHAAFKAKVQAKDGWAPDPAVERPGQRPLRPDAGAPARNPEKPKIRRYVELKPDTPSGRARGASAAKRYQDASGNKTRVVYYDPKKIK
jgi:hypothetical protein